MRVEAIKVRNGYLIPKINIFKNIKHKKILLELEIIDPVNTDDYSALDQLVGLCETKCTDASINHDAIIYSKDRNNDLR